MTKTKEEERLKKLEDRRYAIARSEGISYYTSFEVVEIKIPSKEGYEFFAPTAETYFKYAGWRRIIIGGMIYPGKRGKWVAQDILEEAKNAQESVLNLLVKDSSFPSRRIANPIDNWAPQIHMPSIL